MHIDRDIIDVKLSLQALLQSFITPTIMKGEQLLAML